MVLALATAPLTLPPVATAGPCSTMFGNFGSLAQGMTGAGMNGRSDITPGAGSEATVNPMGSISTALAHDGPLIQQLESGSAGNGLSGSLDQVTGSVYGFPQWTHSPATGTVPVLAGPTRFVQLITGPTSPNQTVAQYGIRGTDLGIMWADSNPAGPEIQLAFGDTTGDCAAGAANWRSNVLLRSRNRDLSAGLSFSGVLAGPDGMATSIVPRSGLPGETTVIPTAGIEVDGVQYLRYMSVARWNPVPGLWTTNYSGLARSTDYGRSWSVVPAATRAISSAISPGSDAPGVDLAWSRAQMSAYLRGTDGYLYEYLTSAGRTGSAILARVPAGAILQPAQYTYWTGTVWSARISDASAVFAAPVSEVSVMWNEYLRKYIAMYSSGLRSVLIRTADRPEGPWSDATTVLDYSILPGVYGGFLHPWTSGPDLYYVVTTWDAYNVFLVRTDLSALGFTGFAAAAEHVGAAPSRVVRHMPIAQLPVSGLIPTS